MIKRKWYKKLWEWFTEWWIILLLIFVFVTMMWSVVGRDIAQMWNKCATYTTVVAGQSTVYGPIRAFSTYESGGKYGFRDRGVTILLEPKDTIVKVEECK